MTITKNGLALLPDVAPCYKYECYSTCDSVMMSLPGYEGLHGTVILNPKPETLNPKPCAMAGCSSSGLDTDAGPCSLTCCGGVIVIFVLITMVMIRVILIVLAVIGIVNFYS